MVERTAGCPSCGAPLRFRGATSVVAVCQFCKATLVRDGVNIENIGKQAELLEDHSPIRIGADGKHKGRGFTVVGRIQYRYGSGVWNEWYVLFADMKGGWLSDASREYTMTFLQAPQPVPPFAELKPGQALTLGKDTFTAMNMEQAEVVAGEGELPFKFQSGWKADVADLRGEGNKFATIDYSEQPPHIYVGEKLPFDQFSFSGLRDPTQIGFVKGRALTFKCGGCGSPLESHLATSEIVACATCGSLTDVTKGVGEVVQKAERHKKDFKPTIPLGAEGIWKTVKYEIVGLMRRQIKVDGQKYAWTEYLGHNTERGYAWVSEYNGHFSVIHNAAEVPKPAKSLGKPRMKYLGQTYDHFQKSEPRVIYLAGEFYWQVRLGDRAVCNDYVCPPLILSSEATGNELTWSFGEYVPGPDLWKVFKLPGKPPKPVGVAPNQPSPHGGKVAFLWKAFLAFAAIALLLQIAMTAMSGLSSSRNPVKFTVTAGDRGQVVSPPFKLGGWLDAPVTVRTSSNVSDTWLNVDVQLTEVETGRAYGTKRALGFNKVGGVVDGSSEDVGEIASVPPGRYTLAVNASSGASATAYPPPTYTGTVEAYRAPVGWSNFLIFLGAIVLWPFIAWRQARAFEAHRWSESDYGDDYAASGSDDDGDE
jgi:hypothetical protein